MKVLSIILGVLLVIAGCSALATPVSTFLASGFFIAGMMLVYGIAGIVRAFCKKNDVFGTIMSVLAVIIGIIALVRPGSVLYIDAMLLYMVAFWFVLRGITSIIFAIMTRKIAKYWILELIIGILCVVMGCYSFAHPFVAVLTTGFLIGFYFIESGVDLIIASLMLDAAETMVLGGEY